MDTIYINDIELSLIVGINPKERVEKQKLLVSVSIDVNHSKAVKSDAIEDTVNYSEIYQKILSLQELTSYNLIESFADHVARICLEDSKVQKVFVKLQKPQALPGVPNTGVTLTRLQLRINK